MLKTCVYLQHYEANLAEIGGEVRAAVRGVAVDGTSSTALLVDASSGRPSGRPRMYDEAQPEAAIESVAVCSLPPPSWATLRARACCSVLQRVPHGAAREYVPTLIELDDRRCCCGPLHPPNPRFELHDLVGQLKHQTQAIFAQQNASQYGCRRRASREQQSVSSTIRSYKS